MKRREIPTAPLYPVTTKTKSSSLKNRIIVYILLGFGLLGSQEENKERFRKIRICGGGLKERKKRVPSVFPRPVFTLAVFT